MLRIRFEMTCKKDAIWPRVVVGSVARFEKVAKGVAKIRPETKTLALAGTKSATEKLHTTGQGMKFPFVSETLLMLISTVLLIMRSSYICK